MNSCLYFGHVQHRRTVPVMHAFRYRLSTFYLDLDELPALDSALWLFGVNRGHLASFHDRDHIDGGPTGTKQKLVAFLARHGITLDGGKVLLLTQCRLFHYVFNPVSFYYCHAANGELRAIAAEVNNTFGERLLYLLSEENRLTDASAEHTRYAAPKRMHVSPFVSMDAAYEFRFAPMGERLSISMRETEHGTHFFDAHLWGKRVALTDRSLMWLLARYPFMTFKIIAAIHWQALKLYRKGVPFHPQPAASPAQRQQQQQLVQLLSKGA